MSVKEFFGVIVVLSQLSFGTLTGGGGLERTFLLAAFFSEPLVARGLGGVFAAGLRVRNSAELMRRLAPSRLQSKPANASATCGSAK
jgi:hypothetical protein